MQPINVQSVLLVGVLVFIGLAILFGAFSSRTRSGTQTHVAQDAPASKIVVRPKILIPEDVFVKAYVLANYGRNDSTVQELKVLGHDEYKMRSSMTDNPYLTMEADGLFDSGGRRALFYIRDHKADFFTSADEADAEGASDTKASAEPDTEPHPTHALEAAYTKEALEQHIEGVVIIRCRVSSEGNPYDFRVVQSLGHGLDESAEDAMRNTGWVPAMQDGKFIDHDAQEAFTFKEQANADKRDAALTERRDPNSAEASK